MYMMSIMDFCFSWKPMRKRRRSSSIMFAESYMMSMMEFFAWNPRPKRRRTLSIMISDAVPELPFEIITEILSCLPVKSLVRFKCVCKQWRSLLLDYKFIAKHMLRAEPLQLSYQIIRQPNKPTYLCSYDENFECMGSVAGLLLERRTLNSRVVRIRNFATRQVVYLPDDVQNYTQSMCLDYDSSTGECKVACFYKNREGTEVGAKVLSIGKDGEWRSFKQQNQNKKGVLQRRSVLRELPNQWVTNMVETMRVGEDMKLEVSVLSFDIRNECFTVNALLQGVFPDRRTVYIIRWKNCAAVGGIVGESLDVRVLEDFQEHKWSRIIVPLKFLKKYPVLKDQIKPVIAFGDQLWFYNLKRSIFFGYNMKQESIIRGKSTEKVTFFQPSLVSFKGMKWEYQGAVRAYVVAS